MVYKIGLLLCLLPSLVHGQFIFQNLRTADGLSSKMVECLYKDNDGILWIGTTKGLNRYDGAVVKQYRSGPGMKDFYINAIQPFGASEMLIGTKEGVKIFDKRLGAFHSDQRFIALDNKDVVSINSDVCNRLWIFTSSEIYVFLDNELVIAEKVIPDLKIIQQEGYETSVITWDAKRIGFWLGGKKTYFIDCKNRTIYHKLNNPNRIPLLDTQDVYAIAVDMASNIWYGCNANQSLNFWNADKNIVTTFVELDGKKNFGGCNYLYLDSKQRLWISTLMYSAFMKEPGTDIKQIPYSQNRTYSIGYGIFRHIIEDNEQNVWIATINGISEARANTPVQAIYQLPSFEFFLQTGFAHSNSIVIDKEKIIASKEEGLIMYDMNHKSYRRHVVTGNKQQLVRNRFMMSTKIDDTWWCAGVDGIHFLRAGSTRFESFEKIKYKSANKFSNFIFADRNEQVWFQIWKDAIYRYSPKTGKLDRFDGTDKNYGEFNYSSSQSFVVRRNGDILFAVNGLGFLKFDAKLQKFSQVPVGNPNKFVAYDLTEDRVGNVWAAVLGRGILKLDSQNNLIDSLHTGNGFPYDNLSSIAMDHLGNVWAGGSEGLLFFNPDSKAVTEVKIDLGQNLQDYWNDIYVANKRVYAAMLDHVVVIDPSKFASVKVKKPPHITSVKVLGNEKEDFAKNTQLNLESDEDYLTFQYASLDHRDVPTLKYSYILEGYDKKWINAGRSLVASYKNLPWGKYTFKVRSTDEHGNWMKQFSSLEIYIMPPWWKSSWFMACIFIILAYIGVALHFYMIRRRRARMMEASIDYFANSVYGSNSVNEICWDIARNCISQLDFQDCVVYLLDKKRDVLVQKAVIINKASKEAELDNLVDIPLGRGIVGTVATTGKHLIIPDTSKDERYIVSEERRLSELAVPLIHDGRVIGVIDTEHEERDYFKDEHLKALSIIASISSGKIAEALAQAATKEKEIELLEINKMLAESQLMALRAQMNPHFVFNCLNSIQECIVTEKFQEASIYLNLFSKLFRTLLNNSSKNLVTIEEELHVLELYLQLEEMRFSRSFSYEIRVDEDLEVEEILVPAMLIQPYVENALWHGLMHSKLERKLLIEFKKIDEDMFECRIDDNGIGRKKSFEIKAFTSKSRHHVSRGLGISSDRLQVLTRQGHHAEVNFIDKMHENGEAAGTLVIVKLSSFLK
ncbi:histidine kinase [Dyadobacter sp. LJ53]|uniref:sensor histidine kinase n=1 Tax=Dyadobacter chenwenxiniae TaxID=2906456 RepID=UPI001F3545AC|nr:histidine kinase [Dyadobacter chenwenxiniae]MCF0051065.1 histidine kinase [Dyadobacter chenwenxiniae]